MPAHETLVTAIVLFTVAIIVSILVRRIKLPYSIGLVLAGLGVGYFQLIGQFRIDPELIFYIFLPPLLFDAGFNASLPKLRQQWKVIFVLAVPGTMVAVLVVGTIIHYAMEIPWMSSLLFAALIVPTDTVSILSVFRELKVPSRLASLVEGESLFNDGTAIILFRLILSLILAEQYNPAKIDYFEFSLKLVLVYSGGLLLGGAFGYAAGILMKRMKDHLVEIMLTVMTIYGVYVTAEKLEISGIVAVVTASLLLGHTRQKMGISPTTQIALSSFWSFIAFALNSVLFIMIGLQIDFHSLWSNLGLVIIALLAVNFGRIVFIYPFSAGVNLLVQKRWSMELGHIPLKWQHVMVLGNLKGSLSMAMVIGLPDSLTYKPQLVALTFGVVFFSLLLQGTTLRPILKHLSLQNISKDQLEFDKRQGLILSAKAVLSQLSSEFERGLITSSVYNSLKEQYELTVENAESSLTKLQNKNPSLADMHLQTTYYQMLILQRSVIQNAQTHNIITEDAAAVLLQNFDQQMAAIVSSKEEA